MTEPDEIQFACIGCGALNVASAEFCAGCGHRFAGPDLVSKVRIALPPRSSDNPFEPPSARIAPPRTFRIGTLLAWIALIAVCLGAFRENIFLGILATLSFFPPAIWTSIKSGRHRSEGRPISIEMKIQTFLLVMALTWAVVFASGIAFCATCIGTAIATNNGMVGISIGSVAGVSCAIWLVLIFIRASREESRREREIRYLNSPSRKSPRG